MLISFLRKWPNFRGKKRLVRLLFKKRIQTERSLQLKGKYDCLYVVPNLTENVSFDIFANGVYEQETIDLICRFLPADGVFIDLGANIGAILVPVAKILPGASIIGVEAAPWLFSYLQENMALNGLSGRVKLYNRALYNTDDQDLNFYSPGDKFGKGSLAPVFTDQATVVKTITLDTICKQHSIDRVDVIKIDVEGFEYFVFQGGKELLAADNAPVIIFEFADWAENQAGGLKAGDAQRVLSDFGYKIYEFTSDKFVRLDQIKTSGSANLIASKISL